MSGSSESANTGHWQNHVLFSENRIWTLSSGTRRVPRFCPRLLCDQRRYEHATPTLSVQVNEWSMVLEPKVGSDGSFKIFSGLYGIVIWAAHTRKVPLSQHSTVTVWKALQLHWAAAVCKQKWSLLLVSALGKSILTPVFTVFDIRWVWGWKQQAILQHETTCKMCVCLYFVLFR